MKIEPATLDHVIALRGAPPAVTFEGLSLMDGARAVAVTGFYPDNGRLVVGAKFADDFRAQLVGGRCRKALIKLGREIMTLARRYSMPVIAIADPAYYGSDTLLKHLGFAHVSREIYEWNGSR